MDYKLSFVIWIFCLLLNATFQEHHNAESTHSVCALGASLSVNNNPNIAACPGNWTGHISNATRLCAAGWTVCSSEHRSLLGTVTWYDARHLIGCYAINAAHDGGTCRPCLSKDDQDNMAGIGSLCPHQSHVDSSCLGEGRMDASCCSDASHDTACSYKPHMTGVICCRIAGEAPKIIVRPEALTHVQSGVTFVLSCQARGEPPPTVRWLKDGHRLPTNNSRIREFESGYLLISEAKTQDSGMYQCIVSNLAGVAATDAQVLITDYKSGCADGSSDGLSQYENIHACKGTWTGHVKRGRALCAKGWQVCSPRHEAYLKQLTITDITHMDGCYAYNAMNSNDGCQRCHRENMAGIGSGCERWRKGHQSCLAQGRMDVLRGNTKNGCVFEEGITTGIVCCKRPPKRKNVVTDWEHVVSCSPRCEHGGVCVGYNMCQCSEGYKGAWCQHPICLGGCIPNSYCIKPGVCRCRSGYTFNGDKCTRRRPLCGHACFNGGICKHGHCKCPQFYHGNMCQYGGTRAILIDQDTGQISIPGAPDIHYDAWHETYDKRINYTKKQRQTVSKENPNIADG